MNVIPWRQTRVSPLTDSVVAIRYEDIHSREVIVLGAIPFPILPGASPEGDGADCPLGQTQLDRTFWEIRHKTGKIRKKCGHKLGKSGRKGKCWEACPSGRVVVIMITHWNMTLTRCVIRLHPPRIFSKTLFVKQNSRQRLGLSLLCSYIALPNIFIFISN